MKRPPKKVQFFAFVAVLVVAIAVVAFARGGEDEGGLFGSSSPSPSEPAVSASESPGEPDESPSVIVSGSPLPGRRAPTISTRSIDGIGVVLVDGHGFTLYHDIVETSSEIYCTSVKGCITEWRPMLVRGGILPTAGDGVIGDIGTAERPDGRVQATYNDLPLYTYTGDDQPGDANGQGQSGLWYAVTPRATTPTPAPTPSGSGGGGGGGGGEVPSGGRGVTPGPGG